jgi:hypothetical protein
MTLRFLALTLGWLVLSSFGCSGATSPYKGVPAPLEVSRATLARGDIEPAGYGAYSYILLPRVEPQNQRYRALVAAWATLPEAPAEPDASAEALNLTYLLTLQRPSASESSNSEWLLAHYDTTRAARIAFGHHLSGAGPFIVTRTTPATFATGDEPVAVIDLSDSSVESMQAWLNYFVRVSERPDRWAMNGATAWAIRVHDQLFALGGAATCAMDAHENGTRVLRLLKYIK